MTDALLSLVGTPYRGCGPDGIDCYGLVRLAVKSEVGVDLPERPLGWRRRFEILGRDAAVRRLDVLCIATENFPFVDHLAVAAGPGNLIHACSIYGQVVCEPLSRWRARIVAVARLKCA